MDDGAAEKAPSELSPQMEQEGQQEQQGALAEPENADEASDTPEPESPSNRREFPRFACEGRAQICLPFGGLLLNGRILDISVAGCFVQASRITLEPGTEVEVFFETKLYKFKVDGHIARLIPGKGVGVMFQNPSPRIAFQIRELISELQMEIEMGPPPPRTSLRR